MLPAEGKKQESPWNGEHALPLQEALTHTHTHSDWDNADTPVDLTCTSLGCWRKSEDPENTHAEGENAPNPHVDRPLPGINIFFVIDVRREGH